MADYLITWVEYALEQYRWSADFDSGKGLVVYIVNHDNRRVVISRVVHLS